jgi:hypothetical protein
VDCRPGVLVPDCLAIVLKARRMRAFFRSIQDTGQAAHNVVLWWPVAWTPAIAGGWGRAHDVNDDGVLWCEPPRSG